MFFDGLAANSLPDLEKSWADVSSVGGKGMCADDGKTSKYKRSLSQIHSSPSHLIGCLVDLISVLPWYRS